MSDTAKVSLFGIFAAIAAVLLGWSGTLVEHSDWVIAIAFLIGAFFSAFAGWVGMNIATKSNVRTTQAARSSLAHALKVSFTGGSVMGLGVAGLAVFGLSTIFIFLLMDAGGINEVRGEKPTENFKTELADIVLRVMGIAGKNGINLQEAIEAKNGSKF